MALERHWTGYTPLHLVLLPLSWLFGALAAARRTLYRLGLLASHALPAPVIIVGNISVGGSGKTPLTLWLAQQLLDAGWHPGIISRGYGGSATHPQEVRKSNTGEQVGDEPLLMAQRELCPVWIGRDRVAAGQALLAAHPECDVILSDDGLQHYRLRRDFEIAVVDGTRRLGNEQLLPAGPLREPVARLLGVDAVVVNGGSAKTGEFAMQLHGQQFYNLLNPTTLAQPADFTEQNVHAVAGIGHPERFFRHLESLGLTITRHPFPDHHPYRTVDLDFSDADAILMTEKDAVKCAAFANEHCWVLRVDAQMNTSLTERILDKINGRQAA
ncbi:Tetraacyldisaccharide 4'-kinase [Ferriphaselus amnicola]|uniref:Tetraacyldisaccharide 4'-kinase n=1 Tax=Ferriphaselus amnicola TaxID=1188319 RepID=A0A2Z6GAD5_9PROT|nr:tetraacyldisaccharide 4'-kinase [Ferriphaselus amnicola]BBE50364.1 Tetraacyldisaccharide 4'-kinase [Ferriphaselus amnicola]